MMSKQIEPVVIDPKFLAIFQKDDFATFADGYGYVISNNKFDEYELIDCGSYLMLFGCTIDDATIRINLKKVLDDQYEAGTLEEYVNVIKQNIIDQRARLVLVRELI